MNRYNKELSIANARLIFRNFKGKKTAYSPEGRRTFNVLLPVELAKELANDGWNIKWPKDNPDGDLLPRTEIIVSFERTPPKIYQKTSRKTQRLDETNVGGLDTADIENVDLIITPYNWEVQGKQGIKGYLKSMYVTLHEDEFEKKYLDADDTD